MPRGVTRTRARRRQSDAKWRASVAMCYNIMKKVIPNQKKLGRRKASKALTLKATERHIAHLERSLQTLIEETANVRGKVVMIEKADDCLVPATFNDIKQDFALKQHALFMSSTSGGRKRYNVPSDIEASLELLSQQACELKVFNRPKVEVPFPHRLRIVDTPRFKPQFSLFTESKLEHILTTPLEDGDIADLAVTKQHKTPAKNRPVAARVNVRTSEKKAATGERMVCKTDSYLKTPSKACKQLPFSSKFPGQHTPAKVKPVSMTTTGIQSSNTSSQSSDAGSWLFSAHSPAGSSSQMCTTPTSWTSSGFTPVKLPYGLDSGDPMMTFPGTPAKSMIGSPLSCISIPETPASCFNGVEYFELTDEEDVASLLCTESIDSMDIDFTNKCEAHTDSSRKDEQQTRCRRRLDKAYGCNDDQTVPTATDNSCLEFDGYLLFHKHNVALMDADCNPSEKAITIAHMWETLESEDRAVYARIASMDQSDSNDLSADLLGIDLKPLQEHTDAETVPDVADDSREVPGLVLDLSEEVRKNFELQFVDGYEDLGVFYQHDVTDVKEECCRDSSDGFEDLEETSQVVPQM